MIIDDTDDNKILVSKRNHTAKIICLYTLLDNDNDAIRPLLSKMTVYINEFNNKNKNKITMTMSFRVNHEQPFKTYDKIWKKIERLMNICFESKPFYGNNDDKYINTKIKIFEKNINTNFHNKKMPKEKCHVSVYQ